MAGAAARLLPGQFTDIQAEGPPDPDLDVEGAQREPFVDLPPEWRPGPPAPASSPAGGPGAGTSPAGPEPH
eukprot:5182375-Lingulodinium_polyedra.AAC.1